MVSWGTVVLFFFPSLLGWTNSASKNVRECFSELFFVLVQLLQ